MSITRFEPAEYLRSLVTSQVSWNKAAFTLGFAATCTFEPDGRAVESCHARGEPGDRLVGMEGARRSLVVAVRFSFGRTPQLPLPESLRRKEAFIDESVR